MGSRHQCVVAPRREWEGYVNPAPLASAVRFESVKRQRRGLPFGLWRSGLVPTLRFRRSSDVRSPFRGRRGLSGVQEPNPP